ncbi:MAG: hypothetical protein IPN19_07185 [Elusimicrobia bacterium]|nr:hypothetical protein [Elusimicrobiota bacterium]
MENKLEHLIELAGGVCLLASKVLLHLEGEISLPTNEREGKREVIKILEYFSENIRKELESKSWPLRDKRQMAVRSLFRGVADIGWYNDYKIEETDVAQLFEMTHRLAEGYRRLPETD